MTDKRKNGMSVRDRELLRRCMVLMAGIIFLSLMAAARARGADYYYGGGNSSGAGQWDWAEDEDEYGVMSDDDHILAARMQRRLVGNQPLYQKRKASKFHDRITIVIREDTSSELASSNDLKADSSNDMTLSNWLTPKFKGGLGTTQHGESVGGNTPTISYSRGRAHKSDSSIERSQTLSATLTGRVIDVQPNGHLVIEARKSVNVNGEIQTVELTGIVDPEQLDSDSAINADYIIDMAISYTGKGPMTRMDKRGWAAKLIDFLNPF